MRKSSSTDEHAFEVLLFSWCSWTSEYSREKIVHFPRGYYCVRRLNILCMGMKKIRVYLYVHFLCVSRRSYLSSGSKLVEDMIVSLLRGLGGDPGLFQKIILDDASLDLEFRIEAHLHESSKSRGVVISDRLCVT